jgi:hypothetical protein
VQVQQAPEDCTHYWPIDGRRGADGKWEMDVVRDPNTGIVL